MTFLLLIFSLVGALVLLPVLPGVIFTLLMLYGLVKLLESAVNGNGKPKGKKPPAP
jgi:hypothetical protein